MQHQQNFNLQKQALQHCYALINAEYPLHELEGRENLLREGFNTMVNFKKSLLYGSRMVRISEHNN